MPVVEFRCTVSLAFPIVISVQKGYAFPPLPVKLANGDDATIVLNIDDNSVDRLLTDLGPNAFAVTHVLSLQINITVTDVSAEDLDRLYCRHGSEPKFRTDGQDYQKVESLGKRVVEDVINASNLVLQDVQTRYGQYWIEPVKLEDGLYPNFLHDSEAEWREPNGSWTPFASAPLIHYATLVWSEKDTYVEVSDWATMNASLKASIKEHPGFSLLASARRAHDAGEIARSILDLGASVEWASQAFVIAKLTGIIPNKSLAELLKYSFYRILTDWVVPLAGIHLPSQLTNDDVRDLHEIRNLRGQAAHALPRTDVLEKIQKRFPILVKSAARIVAILTNEKIPKLPPYHSASLAGGTSP